MSRTPCARTGKLIQLYLDDRLSRAQALALQRHLSGCAACREELSALLNLRTAIVATDVEPDLTPEGAPADLTETIMRRIAAYETRKAVERKALERRPEFIPDFVPEWVGWRSVVVSVALLALVVTALMPGGWNAAIAALLSPGPDQISWAVWLGGGLVTLLAVIWFVRADASSQWRRAISERFPQLW
jgi:anti-sigma factor RsiW